MFGLKKKEKDRHDTSPKRKGQAVLSLKGKAFIAAVETGLLPLVERNGKTGYDDELFDKFWKYFTEMPGIEIREV